MIWNMGVQICNQSHLGNVSYCLLTELCLTLGDPTDCSPPGSLSMGFPRQEYWSGLPFPSGDLPDAGIKPASPDQQADSLPLGNSFWETCERNLYLGVIMFIKQRSPYQKFMMWQQLKNPENRLSIQFSSIAQSYLTLCDPMNCSTPGLPVHHQLPEFIQSHVHQAGDAIQPSHPLSSPSPPAPNPSQHQGLFQ